MFLSQSLIKNLSAAKSYEGNFDNDIEIDNNDLTI